ncbi:hypothetical protein [Geotalea toluenoxydans]|uniref:hypothetical protein n=1 Tax=Geotalea toluenoxydans TaxID=421624 RepID=UPI0006CFFE06|nr:hypothetical protein [Geotalea toluenoxydans]
MKTIDVENSRIRLLALAGEIREVMSGYGNGFAAGSPAAIEAENVNDTEPITGILGQAALMYESVIDHVVATTRIMSTPIQSIAPFSLVRSGIEVSSTCCWLLEPQLITTTRLCRSFALRRNSLEGQRKIINGNPETDDGGFQSRLSYLDQKEREHGLERVAVPSATDLTGYWFGGKAHYRLTSSVVHGQPWAISQVAFTRNDQKKVGEGAVFLEPTLKPNFILYLFVLALDALARPAWLRTVYAGHDRLKIEVTLNNAYNDLQMNPERRFWRHG